MGKVSRIDFPVRRHRSAFAHVRTADDQLRRCYRFRVFIFFLEAFVGVERRRAQNEVLARTAVLHQLDGFVDIARIRLNECISLR